MLLGIIASSIAIPPSVALAQSEGRTVTASDTLGADARQAMIDIFRKKDVTAVDRYFARTGLCFGYRVPPIEDRRVCISPA